MTRSAVANRYAKGLLLAVLGDGSVTPSAVAADLEGIAETVARFSGLRLLTLNPAIDPAKKAAVLDELAERLQAAAITRRFLAVVTDKERLPELASMARSFRALVDAHEGIVNAEVTTPTPLDEAAVESLRQKLTAATGRTVRLHTRVDPGLLGGLVTRIGDVLYDGSLRHQLAHLRDRMMEGR